MKAARAASSARRTRRAESLHLWHRDCRSAAAMMPVVTDTCREWAIKVFVAAASGRGRSPRTGISRLHQPASLDAVEPRSGTAAGLSADARDGDRRADSGGPGALKTWRKRRGGGIERDVECRVAMLRVNARGLGCQHAWAADDGEQCPVIRLCLRHAFGFRLGR